MALKSFNFPNAIYPENFSSEDMLKLDVFQELQNKQIALIKGAGGRDLLADILTKRGAHVTNMLAYRRILPQYPDINEYIKLFQAKKIDVIISTSGEGLYNLMLLFGEANKSYLQNIPIIVVSERLVAISKELNFKKIYLAKNANHATIINMLDLKKDVLCQI